MFPPRRGFFTLDGLWVVEIIEQLDELFVAEYRRLEADVQKSPGHLRRALAELCEVFVKYFFCLRCALGDVGFLVFLLAKERDHPGGLLNAGERRCGIE